MSPAIAVPHDVTLAPKRAPFSVDSTIIEKYKRDGYVIIRGVFSRDEVAEMRRLAMLQVDEDKRDNLTRDDVRKGFLMSKLDMLSNRHLRAVLFDDRILVIARALLAPHPIVYFGNAVYNIGFNRRAWHRDNVDRDYDLSAPDWQDEYRLINIGLYLQDHSEHSGGLKVRVGSHANISGPPFQLDTKAGDVAIWNLRLIHSAATIRLRFAPKFPYLPPQTHRKRGHFVSENNLPTWLQIPEEVTPRIAFFMCFGVKGPHLDRFISKYMAGVPALRETFAMCRFGPEVWEMAERKGVTIVPPVPEYGASP